LETVPVTVRDEEHRSDMKRLGADVAFEWDRPGRRTRWTRRWKKLPLVWPLQLAVVAAFWGGCAALPAAWAARFGAWLGRLAGPRLRYYARVRQNLAMALPTAGEAEIKQLADAASASLGATLAEYAHLGTLADRAELVIDPQMQAYARRGRPAIFVTAHIGNWEIQTAAAAALGMPLAVVYRQKDNPLLEWLIQRCRRPLGCHYVPSHQGARPLLSELRAGRSIALLVDLRVETGDLLPFFGRPAHTTLGPARLAQHVRCPLVPAHAERLGPADHRVVVGAPIWPDPTIPDRDAQARALMDRVNRAIEGWITARPQDWVSIHYRWPEAVRTAALEERARRGLG
jgi:KDO2-lipid IV(A) lauroyltransferase